NLTREATQLEASVTVEVIEPYKKDIQFALTVHTNDIIFQKLILIKKHDVKKN
ncbi:hypothetical protein HY745_01145, partial [Candidatus Desantisbacteria bacterium]|nr:hypothetical protein [Candidatus Desantisbacteria bacterium]